MGKNREAEARAAEARETARQFDELRRRADQISYDKDEVLENLKAASEQIPELVGLYEAAKLDPSALEQIALDPMYAEIQKGNLEAVQEMAEQGGFSEEDMAKRRALQRQVAADESARQKQIVQEMMQRGQAGSGTELLARLGSSQASAQRQAEASDRLAMDSAAARRAALQQASQQAGSLRQQDYGEQSNLASARDQIAQFNAMQRAGTANQNLALRQGIANQATAQKGQYYRDAANTEQQRFANEMSKLGLQSNLVGQSGQARMAGVAPRANKAGMVGTIVGAGAGAFFGGPMGAQAGGQIGGTIGGMFGGNDGGVKGNRNTYADGGLKGKSYAVGGTTGFTPDVDTLRLREKMARDEANREQFDPNRPLPRRSTEEALGAFGQTSLGQGLSSVGDKISGLFSSKPELDPNGQPKQEFKESEMDYSAAYDKAKKDGTLDTKSPDEVKKDMKSNETGETLGAIASVVGALGKQNAPRPAPTFTPTMMPVNVQTTTQFEDGGMKLDADSMRDALLGEVTAFAEGGIKYADGGISPELQQAAQMLRVQNQQPAPGAPMPGGQPPMPPAPMPQGAPQMPPMPPQGAAPMPPMAPAPMPPQGQMMADGGMAYEDGGEGTIIDSGMEMYAGDQLPDRINDGEMVLNVEQQDRLNDALMELKRLKSKERTDKMLHDGKAEVNPMQQEAMMAFVRGEIDVDELPNERVVKEPTVGEPSGRMAELLGMVSRKRRG